MICSSSHTNIWLIQSYAEFSSSDSEGWELLQVDLKGFNVEISEARDDQGE